jgi:RNA polymerase sigma-70 factor (ECF subfamily)
MKMTYQKFYEENRLRLFSYLMRMSGNHALSEDLVQESFVRHLQRYREGESPLALLYTIARNAFFDHLRRRQDETIPLDEHRVAGRYDAEHDLLVKEEFSRMMVALQQLSVMNREILTLLADKGLTYAEIGAILGLSEGNVKVRVHRARLQLRQILTEGEKS